MMNLMKNKIFSVLVGLLAVFLGACSDDDDVLTTSSVHVNGGPLEESITPTSARVRIRLMRRPVSVKWESVMEYRPIRVLCYLMGMF